MEKIEPTTTPNEEKGESYKLEDKDYLLIRAIQDLTTQLKRLVVK